MSLPGKALPVALLLWHRVGIEETSEVALHLSAIPVPRSTARRGLEVLERAGLVSVSRSPGRSPRVTLLRVETSPADGQEVGPQP
jgi:DNA-binding transcriptional ArsR family regulator